MPTLGKTTTPTTPTFGWIQNFGSVAMPFTTSQSGLYDAVTFWVAGDGATVKIHGVIWDSSGNVLAFGPGVNTSGGSGSGVGATQWFTDTFSTPVFIASGTSIYIGWQTDTHSQCDWAFNGNDHSPNAVTVSSAFGSTGQSLSGHTTESPNGAVAVYTTYTQAGLWIAPGGTVVAPVAVWVNTGSGPVKAKGVWVNNGSGGVKQIW